MAIMGMGASFQMPRVVQKVLAKASHTARTIGRNPLFHAGFKAFYKPSITPLRPHTDVSRTGPVRHRRHTFQGGQLRR